LFGRLDALVLEMQSAQMERDLRVIGVQGARAIQDRQRLVIAAEYREETTIIPEHRGAPAAFRGHDKRLDRSVGAANGDQMIRQAMPRFGLVRRKLRRGAIERLRIGTRACREVCFAQ